jgi:hypothetical protein
VLPPGHDEQIDPHSCDPDVCSGRWRGRDDRVDDPDDPRFEMVDMPWPRDSRPAQHLLNAVRTIATLAPAAAAGFRAMAIQTQRAGIQMRSTGWDLGDMIHRDRMRSARFSRDGRTRHGRVKHLRDQRRCSLKRRAQVLR